MKPDECLSRRDLFACAGKCALGAAALAASIPGFVGQAQALGGKSEKWPWPYEKLDPQKCADTAYKEWYRVFCGAAVINSVFGPLAEKFGDPYASFPGDAFIFLEGGVSGWGTICGANSGANIVTNLIVGPRIAGSEEGMLMGSELMEWYSNTAMPTYIPNDPKVKSEIPQTVSNSPLCHISVGKWMKAADKPLISAERKDRCARVTASMTYQLVVFLNDWKDKTYKTKGAVPAASMGIQTQYNCNECHGSNIPSPPRKM
jgi:hypothetical protein